MKKRKATQAEVTRIRLLDGQPAVNNSGRPTKLTPQVQATICEALASGIDFEMAARFAGVHDGSAANWKMWGKQGRSPRLVAFFEAVSKAECDAAVGYAEVIARAAQKGTWPAAAWMLERKYPRVFGQKVRLEVANELESFVRDLAHVLPEDSMEVVYQLVEDRIGPASAAVGERLLEASRLKGASEAPPDGPRPEFVPAAPCPPHPPRGVS
jgi:hypothetical protein